MRTSRKKAATSALSIMGAIVLLSTLLGGTLAANAFASDEADTTDQIITETNPPAKPVSKPVSEEPDTELPDDKTTSALRIASAQLRVTPTQGVIGDLLPWSEDTNHASYWVDYRRREVLARGERRRVPARPGVWRPECQDGAAMRR